MQKTKPHVELQATVESNNPGPMAPPNWAVSYDEVRSNRLWVLSGG